MQRTHFSFLLFATLLIFIGSLFFFSPCYGMEEEDNQRPLPHMKFKLGFEFQEGSSLCPWALENNNVQKKKLFKFKDHDTQKKLWHVVIDTSDIEFVTRPFSYKEQ
ncbi:MAG: hypothetical protein K2P93_03400, partial [Alphaproteobacteria bacterium]|nr:hypothetical protein [Alphaproteobacteria bacterium]